MSAPHPAAAAALRDPARLAAVRRTALLDTAAEAAFDRFTRLAARLLGTPAALVTLLDGERQFCKSAVGLPVPEPPAPAPSLPFSHSFCQHVVASGEPLVLGNVRAHPVHRDSRAARDLGAAAYAGVPLRTGGGHVVGSFCAVDRTARVWSADDVSLLEDLARAVVTEIELRAVLRETEAARETARVLLDASPDAFLAVDGAGRVTYMSERAGRLLACDPAAAHGQPLEPLLPADVREGTRALHARVRRTGRPVELEHWSTAAGQEGRRWVAVHAVPNGADGVAVAVRDVTERLRAEAALRDREARYRALTEQSPEPIFLHRGGRILYANPAGARLLGAADAGALDGAEVFEFIHPDEQEGARASLASLAGGEPQREMQRYRIVRRDGTGVEVEAVSALVQVDGAATAQTILRDVTERNALERQLTYQAFHDPLTGLANRALFVDRLAHALARAASGRGDRDVRDTAVVYLDLDDFKTVNDSLGHAHGDALLREVAARLLRATRGCDTVARLGGDEFAVLLEGMHARADALAVVQRITQALGASAWVDGRELPTGASVGVAYARGDESADELLRNADVAMYQAKAGGKRRHAVFEPGMHTALVARLELEAALRRAVASPAEGGLWVAYQPVVDLASGRVVAFEALARWRRPDGVLVPPLEFVPLAESSGLIIPLGRWVLGEACARAAEWRAISGEPVRVAVNVSGRQLADCAGLAADVARALEGAGLPGDALTLEMTESVLMQRTDETLGRLAALKATGVRLAIDDFGTGYSSLAYLQRFPVDVLKIDKAFVDGVAEEEGDRAIARTVVALGRSLGLHIVAEGVERADQRAALVEMGCAQAQGYLFARPLDAGAATRLLVGAAAAV